MNSPGTRLDCPIHSIERSDFVLRGGQRARCWVRAWAMFVLGLMFPSVLWAGAGPIALTFLDRSEVA